MTKYNIYNEILFYKIGGIAEIYVNNLAKIEQCNIKVLDYYILLDHLYIYYYYFYFFAIYYHYYNSEIAAITYYYYILLLPHPCPQQGSYHRHDVVKTSPRHHQDITITPRRIAEGLPTVADT